jgi:RNA polymerase sigma factor (sigma-70 family)
VLNELTYESFHLAIKKAFVHAVDPAAAYEQLRRKLINYFLTRGHNIDAEYLADEVMDRVLMKVSDGYVRIQDDKSVSNFALGVARNVDLEQRRTKQKHQSRLSERAYLEALQQENDVLGIDRRSKAFNICLKELKPEELELLMEYYIDHRGDTKDLAAELGISYHNLRIRIFRINQRLREMMDQQLNS